jgi:hypothetical protein
MVDPEAQYRMSKVYLHGNFLPVDYPGRRQTADSGGRSTSNQNGNALSK